MIHKFRANDTLRTSNTLSVYMKNLSPSKKDITFFVIIYCAAQCVYRDFSSVYALRRRLSNFSRRSKEHSKNWIESYTEEKNFGKLMKCKSKLFNQKFWSNKFQLNAGNYNEIILFFLNICNNYQAFGIITKYFVIIKIGNNNQIFSKTKYVPWVC